MSVTTGWIVKVLQSNRLCDATTRAGKPCSNTGYYGWGDQRFCSSHHPDWNAWYEEKKRIERIASAAALPAIAKAERA